MIVVGPDTTVVAPPRVWGPGPREVVCAAQAVVGVVKVTVDAGMV